jgi:hypothetical protein
MICVLKLLIIPWIMLRYDFVDDLWALKYVSWNWELKYVVGVVLWWDKECMSCLQIVWKVYGVKSCMSMWKH